MKSDKSRIARSDNACMRWLSTISSSPPDGVQVRVVTMELPPIFAEAVRAHRIVQGYEAIRALAFEYDFHRDRMGPVLRGQLDDAATIDADTYDNARRITRRARRALIDLLPDGEVMLTPSAPGAAPKGLGSTGEPTFNRLWTLLGTPCVNVPGLSDADGLPLGVQVVARFGRDRFALSAAAWLESAVARSEMRLTPGQ